jgi:squalene-hopene/tetraprenyl-beta-curcumene cyclase
LVCFLIPEAHCILDIESEKVVSSLEKAYDYIESSYYPDGHWSDFLTLAGESVYWVSAYIEYALSGYIAFRREDREKKTANYLLKHQQENGGWGYGPGVPADADSTAWCLLFLSKVNVENQDIINRGMNFLKIHQNPLDGGFRTYAMPSHVARFMMINEDISFDGWSSSHMCVTGVAVQATYESNADQGSIDGIDCIKKNQTSQGYWNSYWWNDNLYATTNCMKALEYRIGTDNEVDICLSKAHDWILSKQLADGGWTNSYSAESIPFSTALALRGLLIRPVNASENIRNGVQWILDHQLNDGSWNSNHKLRIPHPSTIDPWNQTDWKVGGKAINAVIEDHRRLYTTATVVKTLLDYQKSSRSI